MRDPYHKEESLTTADLASAANRGDAAPVEVHSPGAAMAREPKAEPLFAQDEAQRMRGRWNEIQTGFVDEPRRAVEQADGLVAEAIKRLAEVFAGERGKLEQQWDRGDNISTEELRVALQRYRSFFTRLLSV